MLKYVKGIYDEIKWRKYTMKDSKLLFEDVFDQVDLEEVATENGNGTTSTCDVGDWTCWWATYCCYRGITSPSCGGTFGMSACDAMLILCGS